MFNFFDGVTCSKPFWCVPYIGTKRKIAADLLRKMISRHPKTRHLYDLFGGGGAMSSCAAINAPKLQTIHYNEYDVSIYSLTRFLHDWFFYQHPIFRWNGSALPQEFYRWIDKEEFHTFKRSPTHLGGLMRTIWGFGQTFSYLYPDEMAAYKGSVFKYIVNGECKEHLEDLYGFKLPSLSHHVTIDDRRMHFQRYINMKFLGMHKDKFEQTLSHLGLDNVSQVQQVHPLQRLYRMSKCQSFKNFTTITNLSYDEVEIPDRLNTVIYLDPPYRGTAPTGYTCGSALFDYEKFYDWIRNAPFPVYISEYDMPSDFTCVMEINVKVALASYCHDKSARVHLDAVEKLYWNNKY